MHCIKMRVAENFLGEGIIVMRCIIFLRRDKKGVAERNQSILIKIRTHGFFVWENKFAYFL